jgi:hypothetical protein
MSPDELEIALRAIPSETLEGHTARHLLESVVRALPRPPAGASVAWRQAHLRGVVEELFAYAPYNPIDAMLACQMVCARHAAADTMQRCTDPTLPAGLVSQMRRTADALLRTAAQTERMLRRGQAGRKVDSPVAVDVGLDLAALDAVWRGVDPMEPEPDAVAAMAPPSPAALHAPTSPAPRARYTVCGERIDLVKLETIAPAGTA